MMGPPGALTAPSQSPLAGIRVDLRVLADYSEQGMTNDRSAELTTKPISNDQRWKECAHEEVSSLTLHLAAAPGRSRFPDLSLAVLNPGTPDANRALHE
jgi:hypothetical protein